MNTVLKVLILGIVSVLTPAVAGAVPDLYVGDTAIYGGVPNSVQPNVLIILDTSKSMNDEVVDGQEYDPSTIYLPSNSCGGSPCVTNTVYKCTAFGLECGNWTAHVADVGTVALSCPAGTNPRDLLQTTGQWNSSNRRLQTSGACASGNGIYATGNWINWRVTAGGLVPKIQIAKSVLTNLVLNTTGVRIGLMVFNGNQGSVIHTGSNSYAAYVKDLDAMFNLTTTNREALMATIDSNDIVADDWTPLAESLFEGMRYYQGAASVFNSPLVYTSPIIAACQPNYIILITDGMSTADDDNILRTICSNGDCDGDGHEPSNDPVKSYPNQGTDYLDDVAHYLHAPSTDLSAAFTGNQSVSTYLIGFGIQGGNLGAAELLNEAAINAGTAVGGKAYFATSQTDLSSVLSQILGQIFEVNSSFVAPVVPVSPENRTYSGGRVYLGFFKPQTTAFWHGNLKKYGINDDGAVVDSNDDLATYIDNNADGQDDRTAEILPAGATNGAFRNAAVSHWSTGADGGNVEDGGTGQVLLDRDFTTDPRKLYTYMGGTVNLTDPSNAFLTGNAAITPAVLGVATATERDRLIGYIHGYDTYNQFDDSEFGYKRDWILGDILHSKPLVVNYRTYTFTTDNEKDCGVNKTLILTGANDGMFHAFRDCNGSEAWAFIPPDVLPNLQYLAAAKHTYFVDGSPTVYRYDRDNDGNIEPADGDRVIVLTGERRGGGYYYALDITDPDVPKYFWRIGANTSPSGVNTEYAELGQTWSDPELAKIKVGGFSKLAAIFGAGYDNFNEDGRYGTTTLYPQVAPSGIGAGNVTSAAVGAAVSPKGRGVYVVEIATVSDAAGTPIAPDFSRSGWKIWGYSYADNVSMRYSIPSAVAAVDTDYNGFVDRFYVGDAGARMWAFEIGNTSPASWTARWIFSSYNGILGPSDTGRKIFYPPSVVFEFGYANLAFGTGDREHPLNTAVVDRMYSLKDRGQITVIRETNVPSELVDVTDDLLQVSTDPTVIQNLLDALDVQYGWYIRLENPGEKVLAAPLTFFYSYYTTYTPDAPPPADPCDPPVLGTGRVYVVDYKTGESVFNYDVSNDGTVTTNTRAVNAGGDVLLKTDRVQTLGSGIPSGVVPILPPDGTVALLVGVGGGLPQPPPPDKDPTIQLYWRRVL